MIWKRSAVLRFYSVCGLLLQGNPRPAAGSINFTPIPHHPHSTPKKRFLKDIISTMVKVWIRNVDNFQSVVIILVLCKTTPIFLGDAHWRWRSLLSNDSAGGRKNYIWRGKSESKCGKMLTAGEPRRWRVHECSLYSSCNFPESLKSLFFRQLHLSPQFMFTYSDCFLKFISIYTFPLRKQLLQLSLMTN